MTNEQRAQTESERIKMQAWWKDRADRLEREREADKAEPVTPTT